MLARIRMQARKLAWPAPKAFTAQLVVLTMVALKMAHEKGTIDQKRYMNLLKELHEIPEKAAHHFTRTQTILKELQKNIKMPSTALYLGRGYNFPIALEGALKLKEISYIHAEGYPAAEMKHGPIALVDDTLACCFCCNKRCLP